MSIAAPEMPQIIQLRMIAFCSLSSFFLRSSRLAMISLLGSEYRNIGHGIAQRAMLPFAKQICGKPCPYDSILSRKERIVKQPLRVRYDEIQQVAARFVLVKLKHQLVPCLAVDAKPCVAAVPEKPLPHAPYTEAVLPDGVHSA